MLQRALFSFFLSFHRGHGLFPGIKPHAPRRAAMNAKIRAHEVFAHMARLPPLAASAMRLYCFLHSKKTPRLKRGAKLQIN